MRMPASLVIQDRKLTHYLLVYQPKDDKSEFLARAGYTLLSWEALRNDILRAVEGSEGAEAFDTAWGLRLIVRSQWHGLNGRSISVVTVWQQDKGSETIRFVTLYPDRFGDRDLDQEE